MNSLNTSLVKSSLIPEVRIHQFEDNNFRDFLVEKAQDMMARRTELDTA